MTKSPKIRLNWIKKRSKGVRVKIYEEAPNFKNIH